jgi:aspartyl-tRNA(Asn)/glutamyl-tRNA(Gln) amidotransferase subunit A
VVDGPLPEAVGAIELLRAGSVVSTELDELLSSELPQWRKTLDPLVSSRIRDGGSISASEYLQRQRRLRQLSQHATTRFDQCQVIASPTVPISPPVLADVLEIENYRPNNLASLRNTCPGNTLGLCAITLPVGLDSAGLPVGMQLLARHGHEEQLLAIAACIERVLGPPISRLGRLPNSSGN